MLDEFYICALNEIDAPLSRLLPRVGISPRFLCRRVLPNLGSNIIVVAGATPFCVPPRVGISQRAPPAVFAPWAMGLDYANTRPVLLLLLLPLMPRLPV